MDDMQPHSATRHASVHCVVDAHIVCGIATEIFPVAYGVTTCTWVVNEKNSLEPLDCFVIRASHELQ